MTPKVEAIVRRIEAARADLLSAVEGLSSEQLRYHPGGDAAVWSVADVLHHLALTDEACAKLLARMLRKAREMPPPPDPDPNGSVEDSIDDMLPRADAARVKAPEIVEPKETIEAAEALSRLQVSRLTLLTSLGALSAYDLTHVTFPHPFFGELNTYQWVLATGWHERRHTRQIERIKSDGSFPGA